MKPVLEGGVYRLILCQFENSVLTKPVLEGGWGRTQCCTIILPRT